jgi:hypothetical protein
MSIHELTQFQTANLVRAANGGSTVFAVIEAGEKDAPERKETLNGHIREIRQLIEWGLLTDVSDKFTEPIQVSKLNNGRGFVAVQLTEQAALMFSECAARGIN